MTHYQRPGLRPLVSPGVADIGRGLYRASNGNGYCVIGQGLYSISPTWVLTQIGALVAPLTTLVSMIDNGITLVLCDNSAIGYQVTLATNAFAQIVDTTGTFVGATKFDIIDGFIVWNLINSPSYGSTLDNVVTFDALYTAAKNGYSDLLVTLFVNRRELLLFGALKSEIWYDAGNAGFPFAELPGAYIEHGCLAPYSVAAYDTSVFWLGQDLSGVGFVFRQRGYDTKTISNPAISYAIRKMKAAGANLADAIGYCYIQDGHVFYVLTFITGNQTWVFDDSIGDPMLAWHQRGWTDANGILNRERAISHAFINGTNVVQDWQNGTLYSLDPDYYFDNVSGVAGPISFTRTFPQIYMGMGPQGPQMADDNAINIAKFTADLDCGNGPVDINGLPPSVGLRFSTDRARTFGATVLQSTGKIGEFSTSPKWGPVGFARYPILELNYSFAGPCALNGGWISAQVANQ